MKKTKKIIVFGTRPEFIKLLPIIERLNQLGLQDEYIFIFTSQHTDLINDLFDLFNFTPSYIIKPKNSYNSIVNSYSFILSKLQKTVDKIKSAYNLSVIISQGDTTSCLSAATIAFTNNIPFAHIEAGLRTNNLQSPFPEEYFRKIISLSASVHFAPTKTAFENLIRENFSREDIIITGNTIVDAIKIIKEKTSKLSFKKLARFKKKKNILITYHRRENQTNSINIFIRAIKSIAEQNPECNFIWILHKNPFFVKNEINQFFENKKNVQIIDHINVMEMYFLYNYSKLIITDSGGIQEEAPSFNIPVIIIRSETERAESVNLGYSFLVENIEKDLMKKFKTVLNLPFQNMNNPYGNGNASQLIIEYIEEKFSFLL